MTANVGLVLLSAAILASSGVPALLLRRGSGAGQRIASLLTVAGAAVGLAGALRCIADGAASRFEALWSIQGSSFAACLDPLGACFLLPVLVVPALGSLYGLGYWKESDHPASARRVGLFHGLLAGSMALVVVARDGVLFLVAWEAMALSAYFLATAEDEEPEVRGAGWVYLVATHLGTLCLVAMFALLRGEAGSFALEPLAAHPRAATAIFVLAVVGFGVKVGIMPLHVWLPGAHANAPSHVSAVLSGVMLKMGVYGIVRVAEVVPAPPTWWGGLLLALGATSAVLGIAFAIGQRDLKRVLAYSSIENVGVIVTALGLALLGRSLGRAELVALGLGGAILHVWNHALMKPLLFLGAGAVVHAAGTRDIALLGGLARRMPRTAALFLVGALAISGLPPLNGFVSELLIYLGLFRTLEGGAGAAWPAAALAAPALALAAALALACFVRLFGAVFLGEPRSEAALGAHEPGAAMGAPMAFLAALCVVAGVAPWLAAPALDGAVRAWAPAGEAAAPLRDLAPLAGVSLAAATLLLLAALFAFPLLRAWRSRPAAAAGTWDCGYARPTARMQYSASSFGRSIVTLFGWALWPKETAPALRTLFPGPSRASSAVPDAVLDRVVAPVFRILGRVLPWFRFLQQGRIHVYLLYFAMITLLLFLYGAGGRP